MAGGEYHGRSNFLSEYAPPSISASLLYKQDLGHSVRIYWDPLFYPLNTVGQEYKHDHITDMTWNIDKLTYLPAGRSLKSIFKRLSRANEDLSIISIFNEF